MTKDEIKAFVREIVNTSLSADEAAWEIADRWEKDKSEAVLKGITDSAWDREQNS